METVVILVVAAIAVAVVATWFLTSFECVQRQLDMDRQSIIML
jgi:hypothetical protein